MQRRPRLCSSATAIQSASATPRTRAIGPKGELLKSAPSLQPLLLVRAWRCIRGLLCETADHHASLDFRQSKRPPKQRTRGEAAENSEFWNEGTVTVRHVAEEECACCTSSLVPPSEQVTPASDSCAFCCGGSACFCLPTLCAGRSWLVSVVGDEGEEESWKTIPASDRLAPFPDPQPHAFLPILHLSRIHRPR